MQSGDRIGIVGVNGGGKTTLLEVLTGIEPPDAGRVSHTSDLRMAVVTQRFDLPDELTIAQVIIEPLELETYEWASNAKVRDVLGGLGIVRSWARYSGGIALRWRAPPREPGRRAGAGFGPRGTR